MYSGAVHGGYIIVFSVHNGQESTEHVSVNKIRYIK